MKKKLALIICIALTLSMLASCDKKETNETKETSEETTTTAAETVAEETTTEETTTEETTTEETSEPDPADFVLDEKFSTDRLEAYRECATKLYEANDKYRFRFDSEYMSGSNEDVLFAYDPETGIETEFYADNGVLTKVNSYKYNDEHIEEMVGFFDSYENFMRFPLMTYLVIDDDAYVEELPDGHYIGYLVAINTEDTNKVLVLLGEPLVLTEEEYNNLKPGDKIQGVFDDVATVESVDESITGPGRVTLSEYDENGSSISFYPEQGSKYAANDTDYLLSYSNDVPVAKKYYFTELTVSSDCEIEDGYYANMCMYEGYEEDLQNFISENGFTDPLSTSVVYFDYLRDAESANGWVKASANMWPCKITNGQLTYINFELR